MTKKQFKELIEKAKIEELKENGFYGALGYILYFLRANNLKLTADQYETLLDAQIYEHFN